MQIWDTVGNERCYTLVDYYCQQAGGIIILFDLTNLKSFINVKNFWYVSNYVHMHLCIITNQLQYKKSEIYLHSLQPESNIFLL